jgi:hypothetical protein
MNCSVCKGDQLPPGSTCICEGQGNVRGENNGLKELVRRLESELEELRGQLATAPASEGISSAKFDQVMAHCRLVARDLGTLWEQIDPRYAGPEAAKVWLHWRTFDDQKPVFDYLRACWRSEESECPDNGSSQ